jgi:hypothetical protein
MIDRTIERFIPLSADHTPDGGVNHQKDERIQSFAFSRAGRKTTHLTGWADIPSVLASSSLQHQPTTTNTEALYSNENQEYNPVVRRRRCVVSNRSNPRAEQSR